MAEYVPEDVNDDFPSVHHELVEALEDRFPDKCPSLNMPDRAIWVAVGRADVVKYLKEMSNRVPTMRSA